MGAATANKTSYGYRVTGDTGAVTVSTSTVWVKRFGHYAKSSGNTATIQNKNGTEYFKCPGKVAATVEWHDVGGESGAPFEGLIVSALSNGEDILYIFVR